MLAAVLWGGMPAQVVAGHDRDDRPPRHLTGKATWYGNPRVYGAPALSWYSYSGGRAKYHQDGGPYRYYAAAGPALRRLKPFDWGWEPYSVTVRSVKTGKAITVWIVDTCGCVGGGIIDLAPAAFRALGLPLSRGVMKVELTIGN